MMKCRICKKEISSGVIEHGFTYCSQEHADKHWRDKLADNWAYHESEGLYRNYEDYMENECGAVIADDHRVSRMSDHA